MLQYTQAITLWESVCSVIEEREGKLEELRTFEKSASDPSRLFAKGTMCIEHHTYTYTCTCLQLHILYNNTYMYFPEGHDGSLLQEAKTRRKIHSVS